MSSALRVTPALRGGLRAVKARPTLPKPAALLARTFFARGKATLPDLSYDYNALEPYISTEIMQLHHSKHHQTYVNGLNLAIETISVAESAGEFAKAASVASLLNFHGGGHINHTLFWENLAPASQGSGGVLPAKDSKLGEAITRNFGSAEALIKKVNAALTGIQGSGWAWLVKEAGEGERLGVVTRANQDWAGGAGGQVPLLGIDAWEHAYYLQYQNRKAEYFEAIWNVVNWKAVERRFEK